MVAGQVARRDPELIGRAVLKGLLERVTAQAVNLVNAHLVARERGLHVSVETDEDAATGYTNLVTVTTQAGAGRKIIAGTVFDGVPRIVRMKDLDVEFIPEGHILVLSYGDRPGMVGKIGSILGRNNVNIASMHVGRRTRRGRAIVVLLLDEDVPPEVMDEVEKAVEADFARVRTRVTRCHAPQQRLYFLPLPQGLGACRRNALARAMRRVQLQGGARGPHARRTLCTLSVRPRAPTPQMGPYHRSRGRSRGAPGPERAWRPAATRCRASPSRRAGGTARVP